MNLMKIKESLRFFLLLAPAFLLFTSCEVIRDVTKDWTNGDVSKATMVTLYLTSEFNSKLRPILEKQLSPGARVASHDHETKGWTPDKIETMPGGLLHTHRIYLWRIKGRGR